MQIRKIPRIGNKRGLKNREEESRAHNSSGAIQVALNKAKLRSEAFGDCFVM